MNTGRTIPSLRTIATHKKTRQIGTLYSTILVNIAIGFVASIINTRTLGPASFGDLKFCTNVFQFLATVSALGLFLTGAQAIARLPDAEITRKRELIGALVGTAALISIAMIVVTALFSAFEPMIFGNDLRLVLLLFSPVVALMVYQSCIDSMLEGDAKIGMLSASRVIPGIAYVVLMLGINTIHPLNLYMILCIQLGVGIAMILFLMQRLHPQFHNLIPNLKYLWNANKSYGWHVYVGILSGVATQYLSTFMISYYLDNTRVGYFALALTITQPLISISTVVGTTYFKEFAHRDILPRRVTIVTALIGIVTLIVFIATIRFLVRTFYTERFLEVASIASIVATGSVMHGMGDYFNRFLGAHARGKQLRNGAIAVGVVNVTGYLILIKLMGLQGAAFTRLFSGAVYMLMMVMYYRRFRKEVVNNMPVEGIVQAGVHD